MKTPKSLSIAFASALCLAGSVVAAESKHTAEYFLTTPAEFENKEVSLDVAFVKPVRWKSPIPELAFFHAMTVDKIDKKPGGTILVVVPAENAEKFAKKYGMDFDGRSDADSLKGTLIASPQRGPKVWLLDTTGEAQALFEKYKAEIIDEGGDMGGRPGPGGRRGQGRPGGPPQ